MAVTKLSHTAVTMYNDCSEKYRLHYEENIRPKMGRSALLFGNAIDTALNVLLETKSLHLGQKEFTEKWTINKINGESIILKNSDLVKYSKADLDTDLAFTEWEGLLKKGLLILEAYYYQVLPKIKNLIVVQKPVELKNAEGDIIRGALDLIVEWEDGKRYLMDNKTSSVTYEPDSASKSPQLSLYYYLEKENYGLDGVGFIVIDKNLEKIVTKTCNGCGDNQISVRHTNCRVKDCSGKLVKTHVEFKVNIDYIINQVNEVVINETIDSFDNANEGITNKVFSQNRKACFGKFGKCDYYNLCHKQDLSGLVKYHKT